MTHILDLSARIIVKGDIDDATVTTILELIEAGALALTLPRLLNSEFQPIDNPSWRFTLATATASVEEVQP